MSDTNDRNINDADRKAAKGKALCGLARTCRCGGRAFHAPTANWQNRVVCLSCGKKWSE